MNPTNSILQHYDIADVITTTQITVGLINETYKIDTQDTSFILQKLNPIFAPEMLHDIEAVSSHLERNNFTVQKIIKTTRGKLWVNHEKEVWRLFSYIPGKVFETVSNTNIAYEAGKILGKFHLALRDLKYTFKHHRPLHHATEEHFKLLLPHLNPPPQRGGGLEGVQEIQEFKKPILELPKLLLPKNLRRTITHGDPKITNVIFAHRSKTSAADATRSFASTHQAVSLIDLDDVGNQHNVVIELGDALRSWCARDEDDPQNIFNVEKFKAAMTGYKEGSRDFLQKKEWLLIPQAVKLITLELASRFLRDYVENSYFGWNKEKYPSRKVHNLARTRGQLALYNDIVKKESEIHEIIRQFN